jgi:hypothetical protein
MTAKCPPYYLGAPACVPNLGDEPTAASWLHHPAIVRQDCDVILDAMAGCDFKGRCTDEREGPHS